MTFNACEFPEDESLCFVEDYYDYEDDGQQSDKTDLSVFWKDLPLNKKTKSAMRRWQICVENLLHYYNHYSELYQTGVSGTKTVEDYEDDPETVRLNLTNLVFKLEDSIDAAYPLLVKDLEGILPKETASPSTKHIQRVFPITSSGRKIIIKDPRYENTCRTETSWQDPRFKRKLKKIKDETIFHSDLLYAFKDIAIAESDAYHLVMDVPGPLPETDIYEQEKKLRFFELCVLYYERKILPMDVLELLKPIGGVVPYRVYLDMTHKRDLIEPTADYTTHVQGLDTRDVNHQRKRTEALGSKSSKPGVEIGTSENLPYGDIFSFVSKLKISYTKLDKQDFIEALAIKLSKAAPAESHLGLGLNDLFQDELNLPMPVEPKFVGKYQEAFTNRSASVQVY